MYPERTRTEFKAKDCMMFMIITNDSNHEKFTNKKINRKQ
jgi:hypothetical protein